MKNTCEKIWKENEYAYKAAYGFIPEINSYLHEDEEIRDCMIVVPGGGYCMCVPPEGEVVAKVFYEQGMNVFVLTYTTDITFSVPLKRQPMEDISRAVRYIRYRKNEYHIDERRLFICGFSAGAHVCGSLAVHFDDIKDPDMSLDEVSNRPDGVILSYPVITTGKYTRYGLKVNKLRYHCEGNTENYLSGGEVIVAYNPDDVSAVWILEKGEYTRFDLIESRFEGKSLSEVEDMKALQRQIVKNEVQENLQAKIDLAQHIQTITGRRSSDGMTEIKDTTKIKKKEKKKKHRDFLKEAVDA